MTDDEVIRILTTDSFNDNPKRYYEALRLAVSGFKRYSKIKKIVNEWDSISDRQTADASIPCYFSKILDVCKENNDRPIVFTISRNDAEHYNIYTRDSRTDLQANVGIAGLFTMLTSISEDLNNKGYAVLFEVD